ncbi:hypothetical protein SJ05684_c13530 [Sinorhizobium sojae CCBAU 05684]|uniref:Uncharacterized protein n=1 Tax=Sinorhizobium sojae CCBAU 05684 TaxID=716928 RepID=A0A249PA63_9HYPH|nr:hypothetical protein SJ05684_c13530 [Sinorhizobium sojae CCBAU 05684]
MRRAVEEPDSTNPSVEGVECKIVEARKSRAGRRREAGLAFDHRPNRERSCRLRASSVTLAGGLRSRGSDVSRISRRYRHRPLSSTSRERTTPRTLVVTGPSRTTVSSRIVSTAASSIPARAIMGARASGLRPRKRPEHRSAAMPKTQSSTASSASPGVFGSANHARAPSARRTGTSTKPWP